MNDPSSVSAALPRRTFLKAMLAGTGTMVSSAGVALAQALPEVGRADKPAYRGPNVVIVRFGGGARRREAIVPETTYAPFLCHELAKRGTLFPQMEVDSFTPTVGVDTSHGQGTLYIITGKYEKYQDITHKFL